MRGMMNFSAVVVRDWAARSTQIGGLMQGAEKLAARLRRWGHQGEVGAPERPSKAGAFALSAEALGAERQTKVTREAVPAERVDVALQFAAARTAIRGYGNPALGAGQRSLGLRHGGTGSCGEARRDLWRRAFVDAPRGSAAPHPPGRRGTLVR